jgi:hypothetical protein
VHEVRKGFDSASASGYLACGLAFHNVETKVLPFSEKITGSGSAFRNPR